MSKVNTKTTVVQLFGGPGSGKSTLAAELFAEMKRRKESVELVREYAKDLAWQGLAIKPRQQAQLFGEQSRRESILYGNVAYIITDSPLDLCVIYSHLYGSEEAAQGFALILDAYRRDVAGEGVNFMPVFVLREKEYDPRGRYEDEKAARRVDEETRRYLKSRDAAVFTREAGVEGFCDEIAAFHEVITCAK